MFEIEGQNTVFHHNSPKLDPDEGPLKLTRCRWKARSSTRGTGLYLARAMLQRPTGAGAPLTLHQNRRFKAKKILGTPTHTGTLSTMP